MASKRKPAKKPNSKELRVGSASDEDQATSLARTALRPTVQAAVVITDYDKAYGNLDLMALVDALSEQTSAASEGDLKRAEAMLTAQAHTLDAIFNNLARRAINAEYMDNLDRYLKLALRRSRSAVRHGRRWQPSRTRRWRATLRPPGQHRPRPAAGEQCSSRSRWRLARGRRSESAKQTIGGERWRTAGPQNGVHARPS